MNAKEIGMEENQPQLYQNSLNFEPDDDNNKILDSDIRMKQSCLSQCIKYQEAIETQIKLINAALTKNRNLQKRISDNISCALVKPRIGIRYRSLRKFVPYFVNDNGETPPKNEDARNKKGTRNSIVINTRKWTAKDKSQLNLAVQEQVLERVIAPISLQNAHLEIRYEETGDSEIRNEINNGQKAIDELRSLPLKELLMKIEIPKIDWGRISSQFLPRHSPFQCELQWYNVNHPNIDYGAWSSKEDKMLIQYAQQNNYRNWVAVAKSLGVNRTPAQCLQRYILYHDKNAFKSRWTADEDQSLIALVKSLGTTSWQQVASYMEGRTGQQCLCRWKFIDPNKRRGAFVKEEDQLLQEGINKYGPGHWSKIQQAYLPWRTDIQIRDRWVNVIDPALNRRDWTKDEEIRLLNLVLRIGKGKWSQIAKEMNFRTDHQCRRKWLSLQKSSKKRSLEHIQNMIGVSNSLASDLEGTSTQGNNGTDDQQCQKDVAIPSTGHLVKASENLSEKRTGTKRSFDRDADEVPQVHNRSSEKQNKSDECTHVSEKFTNNNELIKSFYGNSAVSITSARAQEDKRSRYELQGFSAKKLKSVSQEDCTITKESINDSMNEANTVNENNLLNLTSKVKTTISTEVSWEILRLQRSVNKKLRKLTTKYSQYLGNKDIDFPSEDKALYEQTLKNIKNNAYYQRQMIAKQYLVPIQTLPLFFNFTSVLVSSKDSGK